MTIWNERYEAEEYIFGKEPNVYFRSVIDLLEPGRLLVPGAGEGRDAVYAATLGWKVDAFDLSDKGRQKAIRLAGESGVEITYEVTDAATFDFNQKQYDLVAMTFLHLPEAMRRYFFGNIHKCLRPGGKVVIEAFNTRQLSHSSGGPKDINMLFTPELLKEELIHIKPIKNVELTVFLEEGSRHQGKAEVIRFLGVRTDKSLHSGGRVSAF